MAIAWNPSYAIGYSLIDNQHEELFNRFNRLMEACRQQKGRQEIGRLFAFLEQYVTEHFAAELALMEAHSYPDMAMHQRQHQEFVEKLRGWQRHLQQEGATLDLLVETNEALIQWLLRHIRTVDGALGQYLASRRV